jgi:hypothetical protein
VHREIKENLAATNVRWLYSTRCGFSRGPVFGETSGSRGGYELQATLCDAHFADKLAQSGDPGIPGRGALLDHLQNWAIEIV